MLIIVSIWALGILVGNSLRTKFNLTFKYKKVFSKKLWKASPVYLRSTFLSDGGDTQCLIDWDTSLDENFGGCSTVALNSTDLRNEDNFTNITLRKNFKITSLISTFWTFYKTSVQ